MQNCVQNLLDCLRDDGDHGCEHPKNLEIEI